MTQCLVTNFQDNQGFCAPDQASGIGFKCLYAEVQIHRSRDVLS
jgi:hypothetical protein